MRTRGTDTEPHIETIGGFLLRRLREVGLGHVFGVAGDFNLELLELMEDVPDLAWVGCCNELNASYAADGHARTHGLSALMTTYGVGELSALCGIAGAFAEHVPVISICGAPPLSEIRRRGLLHHTAGDGDYDNMMICARQFSIAQARIEPQNAAGEIDRCLRACLIDKQPVYLQFPSDIAAIEIETPRAPSALGDEATQRSDPQALDAFLRAAAGTIDAAANPAILVDADVARFGLAETVLRLAEILGCPVASMGTAKGVIDETSPAFVGLYSGAFSKPSVREAIESADCLLRLGVRFIDSTTGSFSQAIDPAHSIEIDGWSARVDGADFEGLSMADALVALAARVKRREARAPEAPAPKDVETSRKITQAGFWLRIAAFLEEDDVIVAENGTSLSGVAGTPLPKGASVLSQALWGAIGYSLPATFGSMLAAPDRRHVLFIGDGSFQLTAQELSSILRHDLKPIIFLINNDGYTIERLILGETSSYNDIQPWKYAGLCDVFADGRPFDSRRVASSDDLDAALAAAGHADRCTFIEVVMDRMDAPEALRRLGPVYAEQDYGRSWADRASPERVQ